MTSIKAYIIRTLRRLSVITAAAALILAYLALLNYFGAMYGAGAGSGWGSPLLWFASAVSALVVLFAAAWSVTRAARWVRSRFTES